VYGTQDKGWLACTQQRSRVYHSCRHLGRWCPGVGGVDRQGTICGENDRRDQAQHPQRRLLSNAGMECEVRRLRAIVYGQASEPATKRRGVVEAPLGGGALLTLAHATSKRTTVPLVVLCLRAGACSMRCLRMAAQAACPLTADL
jgi:hypothetical protein